MEIFIIFIYQIVGQIFTLCMTTSWISIAFVFNLVTELEYVFGNGGIMYFFGLNCLLAGVFVIFYFPETKGKTIEEIAEFLSQ